MTYAVIPGSEICGAPDRLPPAEAFVFLVGRTSSIRGQHTATANIANQRVIGQRAKTCHQAFPAFRPSRASHSRKAQAFEPDRCITGCPE